ERDLRIGPLMVGGRGHQPVPQREDRGGGLHRPGGGDEVAGDALGRRDRRRRSAEDLDDGLGLGGVVERRRGAVGVDVSDGRRREAGVVEGQLHAGGGARTTRRRGGDVV